MKLYGAMASDTGSGQKTRGGNKVLQVKLTADSIGGRSTVSIRMEVQPDGSVVLQVNPIEVCAGFKIAGR